MTHVVQLVNMIIPYGLCDDRSSTIAKCCIRTAKETDYNVWCPRSNGRSLSRSYDIKSWPTRKADYYPPVNNKGERELVLDIRRSSLLSFKCVQTDEVQNASKARLVRNVLSKPFVTKHNSPILVLFIHILKQGKYKNILRLTFRNYELSIIRIIQLAISNACMCSY